MILDFFSLSFKNLKSRSLRTWLTLLGIFIGISLVVSLISLGQGLQNAINDQFASMGADKIIIQPTSPGFGPPGEDSAGNITDKDVKIVRQVAGIKAVATRMMQSIKISYKQQTKIKFAATMPEEQDARAMLEEAQNLKILDGRNLKATDSGKVVLGYNYGYKKIFQKNLRIGQKVNIEGKEFEIIGIAKRDGNPARDDLIILNEDDFKKITNKDDYDFLYVQAQQGTDINDIADKIKRVLRNYKGQKEGYEDFEVQTSQELIESFNNILDVVQIFVIGIAAISLIVGGIGIMNTMYTSVLERTREIGVMKAIGAKNSDIMKLFMIESGLLGMAGGLIGLLLGIGLSMLVSFGAQQALGSNILTAHFSLFLIIGTLLFSFILGAFSGTFPAMQASKMNPVDALRK